VTDRSGAAPQRSAEAGGALATIGRPRRARDASASRRALLQAAQLLFGQRGFEATTIREIGEHAGVDAALIARYFGSKADLYIASLVAETQGHETPADYMCLEEIARSLLTRADEHGLGPVTQALIRADTPEEIREAARAHVWRRVVAPLVLEMKARGIAEPGLQAEAVASALLGVVLGRALGWFADLQEVTRDSLVELITALLDVNEVNETATKPEEGT
jgi:AcrR family transcriptional regulator